MTTRRHSELIGGCPYSGTDAPRGGCCAAAPSPGVACPSPSLQPRGAAEQRHSMSCLCRAPSARTRPL
eukprot:8147744-Pyramimonas_sp.AAC.1